MRLIDKVKGATQKAKDSVANIKVEDITSNLKFYEKYFSDKDLWEKLEKFGKTVGATVIYPVLLLVSLLRSDEIGMKEKAMIIGTLGYFILPTDLIPDVSPFGFIDDESALYVALTALAACISENIRQESKGQLQKMFGEYDEAAVDKVNQIISNAIKARV